MRFISKPEEDRDIFRAVYFSVPIFDRFPADIVCEYTEGHFNSSLSDCPILAIDFPVPPERSGRAYFSIDTSPPSSANQRVERHFRVYRGIARPRGATLVQLEATKVRRPIRKTFTYVPRFYALLRPNALKIYSRAEGAPSTTIRFLAGAEVPG